MMAYSPVLLFKNAKTTALGYHFVCCHQISSRIISHLLKDPTTSLHILVTPGFDTNGADLHSHRNTPHAGHGAQYHINTFFVFSNACEGKN